MTGGAMTDGATTTFVLQENDNQAHDDVMWGDSQGHKGTSGTDCAWQCTWTLSCSLTMALTVLLA